jgi:hypothetical protein
VTEKALPTFRELFVRLIGRSLQEQFGLAAERLHWVSEFMLRPNADHFSYAHQKARDGMVVFLVTNLRDVFFMETDVDLEERLHYSYFRHDDPEAYYLLKVNPVVNRVLSFTTEPSPLPVTDEKYALIRKGDALSRTANLEEMHALAILRTKGNHSVTFEYADGDLARAIVVRHEESGDDLTGLLDSADFQDVTIKRRHGRVQHVERRVSNVLERNVDPKTSKRIPIVIKVLD